MTLSMNGTIKSVHLILGKMMKDNFNSLPVATNLNYIHWQC